MSPGFPSPGSQSRSPAGALAPSPAFPSWPSFGPCHCPLSLPSLVRRLALRKSSSWFRTCGPVTGVPVLAPSQVRRVWAVGQGLRVLWPLLFHFPHPEVHLGHPSQTLCSRPQGPTVLVVLDGELGGWGRAGVFPGISPGGSGSLVCLVSSSRSEAPANEDLACRLSVTLAWKDRDWPPLRVMDLTARG